MPATELHADERWLTRYRLGEAEALERVYATYGPELEEVLRRGLVTRSGGRRTRIRLTDDDERTEVVNEVFSRAFAESTRARYTGNAPFFPYLSRICRNVVVDRHRRQRADAALFRSDVTETPSGQWSWADRTAAERSGPVALGRSPERSASRAALAEALAEFLETLDDDDRALLRLYYEDDASQRDAAARLGLGRQQVRTATARLRKRLLGHLRGKGWIEDLDAAELLGALAALAMAGGL